MIQIAIDIAGPPPAPPRAAPISAAGGGFEQIIERFAVAEPSPDPLPLPLPSLPPPAATLPPERQDLAGQEDEDVPPAAEEEEEDAGEPIWLPPTMTPAPRETPVKQAHKESPPLALVAEAGRGDRRFVAEQQPPAPAKAASSASPALPADAPELPVDARQLPVDSPDLPVEAEPVARERLRGAEIRLPEPKSATAQPAVLPAAIPPQPSAQAALLPAALPPQAAAIAFAAQLLEPAKPETAVEPSSQATDPLTGLVAHSPGPARVEPMRQTQDAPLDMGRDDWIESMIERIDTMREEGGDRAAQIRLRPDALGAVDVRIRHEGAQVHIHFAAETAAARSLLNEAAPRLSELAEARGLKLGDTGVGQGFGGERREAPPAPDPSATNRAPRAAQPSHTDRSGERIA